MSLYQKIKIKIRNRWNDFHFKKMFLLIIFIMSIVSCYLPILIISTIPTLLPYIFIEKSWIAYLFLPIPILSIIFGIRYKKLGYKCQKNIIIGFIASLFIILYGSSFLYYNSIFSIDYSIIEKSEKIINFKLRENTKIQQTNDNAFSIGNSYKTMTSIYIHLDSNQIKKIDKLVKNSDNWLKENDLDDEFDNFLPNFTYMDTKGQCYYLVYVEDLEVYNKMPNDSTIHTFYYFIYNKTYHELEIDIFNEESV